MLGFEPIILNLYPLPTAMFWGIETLIVPEPAFVKVFKEVGFEKLPVLSDSSTVNILSDA